MKQLIDLKEFIRKMEQNFDMQDTLHEVMPCHIIDIALSCDIYDAAPTVDAVPVKVIESWLYSIAMNNAKNGLCDTCEEIIKRLDVLVRYNAEQKDGERE